jgi:hypothetical protein
MADGKSKKIQRQWYKAKGLLKLKRDKLGTFLSLNDLSVPVKFGYGPSSQKSAKQIGVVGLWVQVYLFRTPSL